MRNIWTNSFIFVFVLLLMLLLENSFTSVPDSPSEVYRANGTAYGVRRVIDGDTVVLYKGQKEETVRLIGIDAPESEHAPGGPECYNQEAMARAHELLEGVTVLFVQDPTQDKRDEYGRMLGYMTLPDGTDFGARMIEDGFAHEYTFKGKEYQRQSTYRQLAATAEGEHIGLWGCEEYHN